MTPNGLKIIELAFRKFSSTHIIHKLSFSNHRQSGDSSEFISADGMIISLSTERPVLFMVGTPAQQFANMKTIWTGIGMWPNPMEERYRYRKNFRAAFQFDSDPEKLLAGFWGEKLTLVFAVPDEVCRGSVNKQVGDCRSKPRGFGFAAEADSLGVDHQLACEKFYGN